MTTNELIEHLEPGSQLAVQNEPFHYVGKAEVKMRGGDQVCWLYDRRKAVLSINLETDEIFIFWPVGEEADVSEDVALYGIDQFESLSTDEGHVHTITGDVPFDEKEPVRLREYQNDEGKRLRIIQLQNTGQEHMSIGETVLEEDIFSHDE